MMRRVWREPSNTPSQANQTRWRNAATTKPSRARARSLRMQCLNMANLFPFLILLSLNMLRAMAMFVRCVFGLLFVLFGFFYLLFLSCLICCFAVLSACFFCALAVGCHRFADGNTSPTNQMRFIGNRLSVSARHTIIFTYIPVYEHMKRNGIFL